MMKAWLVKLTNITFVKMSICHIGKFSQLLSFTCTNFHYLLNFALAQHALVHLVQKAEILSECEGDTLYDPLGQLLACLWQLGQGRPAKNAVNCFAVENNTRFTRLSRFSMHLSPGQVWSGNFPAGEMFFMSKVSRTFTHIQAFRRALTCLRVEIFQT